MCEIGGLTCFLNVIFKKTSYIILVTPLYYTL